MIAIKKLPTITKVIPNRRNNKDTETKINAFKEKLENNKLWGKTGNEKDWETELADINKLPDYTKRG